MRIAPINAVRYSNVKFKGHKPNKNTDQTFSAVDVALSGKIGREMIALINGASTFAKGNNTTVREELNRMQKTIEALDGMDDKDTLFTAGVLKIILDKDNPYTDKIEAHSAVIAKHVTLLDDFLSSEDFVKLRDKASNMKALSGEFSSIGVKCGDLKGAIINAREYGTYMTIEDKPDFKFWFQNQYSAPRVTIFETTENGGEEYTYYLDRQEQQLDNSKPITVRRYRQFGSMPDPTMKYVWKKSGSDVSVLCSEIIEKR